MSAVDPGSISAAAKLAKPFDLCQLIEAVTSVAERAQGEWSQTTGEGVGPTPQPASPL
jgi:hypothetical protein